MRKQEKKLQKRKSDNRGMGTVEMILIIVDILTAH